MSIKSLFATFAVTRKTSYVIVKKRRKLPRMSKDVAMNGYRSSPTASSTRWTKSEKPRNWRFWRSSFGQDTKPFPFVTEEKGCAVANYRRFAATIGAISSSGAPPCHHYGWQWTLGHKTPFATTGRT